ncbi:3-deoxy-D-manno-octulosonic acid transferase [Sulfitobacter albidus]|uniref:3-deoxy-D-manno-octulosonic acid transferase n=1 Tax=Sulfitobacter albidus TaxID=2829501 RepID=A0A975PP84_9RHOB|nr:glycosyltransferase N-terminal domain-containing protein [Sulfitobacter albidus]QUJ78095.1 3-deoxy-D-manno-octulosonic acid transferase [Sulfitobacter albidus]
MARSLGLRAYRALARRTQAGAVDTGTPRPAGELLWLHCARDADFLATVDLAAQQIALREGLSVLVTLPAPLRDGHKRAVAHHYAIHLRPLPGDHPDACTAFIDHWRPDCGIWIWGALQPNLILAADDSGVPLILLAAHEAGFEQRRDRWLPDVLRTLLPLFMTVLAASPAAVGKLTQTGLDRSQIELASALLAGGRALPCNPDDETELTAACVGRPVWFANGVEAEELGTVLAAHRRALRLSHRLLLVLRPAKALPAADAMAECRQQDFRACDWDNGEFPDESTQVLHFQDPREIGLFYRLAPVSFLGGSLGQGTQSCDPMEAAALGSAILYGPRVGPYLESYTRLANEGAARIVNDSTALGTAVTQLVAPDQAALMARAGWRVVSEGAALFDRISDLIQDTLDTQAGTR